MITSILKVVSGPVTARLFNGRPGEERCGRFTIPLGKYGVLGTECLTDGQPEPNYIALDYTFDTPVDAQAAIEQIWPVCN